MSVRQHARRAGAYLDRLPSSGRIALAGFGLQAALAVGLLVTNAANGDRVGVFVAAVLFGITVVAGVVAVPAVVCLAVGRYERPAAVALLVVALGAFVLNGGHPTVWPVSFAFALAAVRAWAGASLDVLDLFALDPGRFERVTPGTARDTDGEDE